MTTTKKTAFKDLSTAEYVSLTTLRKNGTPVATPVWFAQYEPTGTLYVETGANSGKVKRIRHTPQVTLAICNARGTVLGKPVAGLAREVKTTEEIFIARGSLHKKYGLKRQIFYFVMNLGNMIRSKKAEEHGYLAIDPID